MILAMWGPLKEQAQAKIIKKSVILFLDIVTTFLISNFGKAWQK